jgi:1-acyl-sn-glycerol-3-phosphate acyltransferase
VALRAGAPILPVAITGTEVVRLPSAFFRPFHRTRVRMVVGEPFFLPPVSRARAEDVERCTDIIMSRIAVLLPSQYRGHYKDAAPPDGGAPAQRAEAV